MIRVYNFQERHGIGDGTGKVLHFNESMREDQVTFAVASVLMWDNMAVPRMLDDKIRRRLHLIFFDKISSYKSQERIDHQRNQHHWPGQTLVNKQHT